MSLCAAYSDIKEIIVEMKLQHAIARMIRYLLQMIGVLALLLCLSAWSFPSSATGKSTAFVRLVHASPDIGIVDVFVDGTKLLSSFQFATVTEYVPLPEGSHRVQLALLGKGVSAAMVTQTINVQSGDVYTVAALGTRASGFSFTIFTDNNVINGNIAELRAYHLSPGTDPVNVNEGQKTVIRALGYAQVSNYVSLSAGQHAFALSGSPQHVANTFAVTLKPWTVTSVFVIGVLNGKPGLQFVTSQIQGVPGMPNTGSDPHPQVVEAVNVPWSPLEAIGMVSVIILSGCVGLYFTIARKVGLLSFPRR